MSAMADEFSSLLAEIGDENAFLPDALLAAAIQATAAAAAVADDADLGLSILPTSPADDDTGDADILPTSPWVDDTGDAHVMPSSSPHLHPYFPAPDVGPSDVDAALAARYDVVFGDAPEGEHDDAEGEHDVVVVGDEPEGGHDEVEGSDTEAEHEEDHHLWSVRPGHQGRSTDLDWHEMKRPRHEQEVAEVGNLRWQERGPVPKAGAERPGFWRGQAWRPGSERWSNRGGRNREYYQWLARAGGMKGGKWSGSGDGYKGGKSSGSGDGYEGGKSSGSGDGYKGGKSSGSGKGGKGKDGKGMDGKSSGSGKGGKGKGGR